MCLYADIAVFLIQGQTGCLGSSPLSSPSPKWICLSVSNISCLSHFDNLRNKINWNIIFPCNSFIQSYCVNLQKSREGQASPEWLRFFLVLQLDPGLTAVFIFHIICVVAPLRVIQLFRGGEYAEFFTLVGIQLQSGSFCLCFWSGADTVAQVWVRILCL